MGEFHKLDDFELGKYLGSGQFGQVWLVRHKKTGLVVALKLLDKAQIAAAGFARQLRREIEIHRHLKHRNILRLHGFFYDSLRIYLVLEFAAGGELFEYLQRYRSFSETTVASYILQVCAAVKCLQKFKVIHRDLKPENILLASDGTIKIADFGAAVKNVDCKRYTMCGTKEYLAPEMWARQRHAEPVDVWCIGVLAFELLTGTTPFGNAASDDEFRQRVGNLEISFPKNISQLARDFVLCFLKKDPSQRILLDNVPKHIWIVQNTTQDLRNSYYTD